MDTTGRLIEAIKNGDATAVEEILASDPALVNTRNERGETPILAAAYRWRRDFVDRLLNAGAQTDVHEAAAVGQTERVRMWIASDPDLVNAYARDGFTPLGLAAFFGHEETVAFLLANGAAVNAVSRNDFQVMPIHSAVAARHLRVAALLLDHGADANATQEAGFSPLHSAANNGQEEMARLLLDRGADVNAKSPEGVTPLRLAVERGHASVADLLRRSGAVD